MHTDKFTRVVRGYHRGGRYTSIGLLRAQLDDQTEQLHQRISNIAECELKWQPVRGCNTIGMLLAHIAITECYWTAVAYGEIDSDERADSVVKTILGIGVDDDGMPLPPAGTHPRVLWRFAADDYLDLLRRARVHTIRRLQKCKDTTLMSIFEWRDQHVSLGWVINHLVEHIAYHRGQISLLRNYYINLNAGQVR
jgi:uncharacterized damage-inducible protein DinB